jgi:hypothetical protein
MWTALRIAHSGATPAVSGDAMERRAITMRWCAAGTRSVKAGDPERDPETVVSQHDGPASARPWRARVAAWPWTPVVYDTPVERVMPWAGSVHEPGGHERSTTSGTERVDLEAS